MWPLPPAPTCVVGTDVKPPKAIARSRSEQQPAAVWGAEAEGAGRGCQHARFKFAGAARARSHPSVQPHRRMRLHVVSAARAPAARPGGGGGSAPHSRPFCPFLTTLVPSLSFPFSPGTCPCVLSLRRSIAQRSMHFSCTVLETSCPHGPAVACLPARRLAPAGRPATRLDLRLVCYPLPHTPSMFSHIPSCHAVLFTPTPP